MSNKEREESFEEHFKRVFRKDEITPPVYDSVAFMFYEFGTRSQQSTIDKQAATIEKLERQIEKEQADAWKAIEMLEKERDKNVQLRKCLEEINNKES